MTTESVARAAAKAPTTNIAAVVTKLRDTFKTGRTRTLEWRKQQLQALERMMVENEAAIAAALEKDLGRSPFEAWLADIASTAGEAKDAAKNVRKWMRRKYRLLELSQLPGRGWVEYEPYGTLLIIGAWNFPFVLTLGPAVGAIAAGNTVVLKPSEVCPASSALMAELVPKYLDNDAIVVVEGDGAVSQELIAQGFDHICSTGGTEIGRKVYEGAAPHLTPVTLELGGKSPCDRRDLRPDSADHDRPIPRRCNRFRELQAEAAGCLPVHQDEEHSRAGDQRGDGRRHGQPPALPILDEQAAVRRRWTVGHGRLSRQVRVRAVQPPQDRHDQANSTRCRCLHLSPVYREGV